MSAGGILRLNSIALVGEQAAESMRNFYCDNYFLRAGSIDVKRGLMSTNIEEASLAKLNIKNSKMVIALIDSSKFRDMRITTIAPLREINTLITDSGIPHDIFEKIRGLGVDVIIVNYLFI